MNQKKGSCNTYKERPVSDRPKMARSQRAKQFAPFDALTGLSERLRQAEEEHRRDIERTTLLCENQTND